jgi:hypothetical protein
MLERDHRGHLCARAVLLAQEAMADGGVQRTQALRQMCERRDQCGADRGYFRLDVPPHMAITWYSLPNCHRNCHRMGWNGTEWDGINNVETGLSSRKSGL